MMPMPTSAPPAYPPEHGASLNPPQPSPGVWESPEAEDIKGLEQEIPHLQQEVQDIKKEIELAKEKEALDAEIAALKQ